MTSRDQLIDQQARLLLGLHAPRSTPEDERDLRTFVQNDVLREFNLTTASPKAILGVLNTCEELRLTLAAERGDPAGALEGWATGLPGTWDRDLDEERGYELVVERAERGEWGWRWWVWDGVRTEGTAPTARQAMQAAETILEEREG